MKTDTVRKLLDKGWDGLAKGDSESARRVAKEVLAFYPSDVEALVLLGKALKDMGALDEAVALFERAYRLDPMYPEAAISAAETHIDYTRDFQEAERLTSTLLESIQKLMDSNSEDTFEETLAVARMTRADALMYLGKFEQALADLDDIPERMKNRMDYMQIRARVLYYLNRLDEAFDELSELVERDGDNPDYHYALALVHLKRDEEEEAIWEFQKVLELESSNDTPDSGMPMESFENLAKRVIKELPKKVKAELGRLDLVVQARPTDELIEDGVNPRAPGILQVAREIRDEDGFELEEDEGNEPGRENSPVKLLLFKNNLESYCRSVAELEREIWNTVMNEAEHLLGVGAGELE